MPGQNVEEIVKRLGAHYSIERYRKDPFKVLIFTIISQRTRDESTAMAGEKLFSRFKNAEELANADVREIEQNIKKAGFYRVKARRIKQVSEIIVRQFRGRVPNAMKELLELPGVGRKTANCVLVYGFGKNAIPVDTHVHRISNRLGLVSSRNPGQTEEELKRIVPQRFWINLNALLVRFGQDICRPIKPKCESCFLSDICDRRF